MAVALRLRCPVCAKVSGDEGGQAMKSWLLAAGGKLLLGSVYQFWSQEITNKWKKGEERRGKERNERKKNEQKKIDETQGKGAYSSQKMMAA